MSDETSKPGQSLVPVSTPLDSEKMAVALEYDGKRAPFVTATGQAITAEEIIEIARAHEIPIYENHELARMLSGLELGEEIPEILYLTIAQIIAFVYMLQDKVPKKR